MEDLILWARMKKGDQKALKLIYELTVRDLETYSKKFTKETVLIEDAIHDLFVYIWQKRESIGETDNIIKYLCVSLRRDLIKRISATHKTSGFEVVENTEADFSLNIEDVIIKGEDDYQIKVKLKNALDVLSGRQKEALFLKYFDEMSYEDICDVMDISYQSVRNLISKAIIVLRENLTIIFLFYCTFLCLISI